MRELLEMTTTEFILIFSLTFVCVMTTSMEHQDPLVKALHSFQNEEQKLDFLKFHLLRGLQDWAEKQPRPPKFLLIKDDSSLMKALNISEENASKFENFDIPKESSRKLLDWTKSEFSLTTRGILELVKSKCYRPPCLPDIGELCCPW